MPRKKVKKIRVGDLVVVRSPFIRVTLDGFVKADPEHQQNIRGCLADLDQRSDSKRESVSSGRPIDIPYGTVAILIDETKPLIMHEGKILMVPRSCLCRIEDD